MTARYGWDDAASTTDDDLVAPGYVQHAQCGECHGELHTLLPNEEGGVPASEGTVWVCSGCHLVRLVPRMTPELAQRHLLWGMGEGPPDQWHYVVAQESPYLRVVRTGG